MKKIIFLLLVLAVGLITVSSQLPSQCEHLHCASLCTGGGHPPPACTCCCDLILTYETCRGSVSRRIETCQNDRCTRDCDCTCDIGEREVGGMTWYDRCFDRYFSQTYDCNGCPTPTPTPRPGNCASGFSIEGGPFKEDNPDSICSPCNADPVDVLNCQLGGGTYDWNYCSCGQSPILIDILGNGFDLTNAANGVNFDINADGQIDKVAWTSANSDDSWLALDRDDNGSIDSGRELFGNNTPQSIPPSGTPKNGFLALAEYDKAANGGNGDGEINSQDAVFPNLRLWQDANHNGLSETSELKTLAASGLAMIHLDYKESRREDGYGNKFKYRAKVKDAQGAQIGRWAWDVYLLVERPSN